jgi:hypothetical protein
MNSLFTQLGIQPTKEQLNIFFKDLTKLVYNRVSLRSVTYQDEEFEAKVWNKDITCGCDSDCECEDERLESIVHPKDGKMVIYNLFPDQERGEQSKFDSIVMNKDNWTKFILDLPQQIVLHNSSGENSDDRGSNDADIILDFNREWKLPVNCTLADFIDGCFRVKSHKFDFWYELFVKVHNIEQSPEQITLYLDFDHGS